MVLYKMSPRQLQSKRLFGKGVSMIDQPVNWNILIGVWMVDMVQGVKIQILDVSRYQK